MDESAPRDEQLWESGWGGHSRAQRVRLARLPLTEKLRWLEEAQRLVHHLRSGQPHDPDGSHSLRTPE